MMLEGLKTEREKPEDEHSCATGFHIDLLVFFTLSHSLSFSSLIFNTFRNSTGGRVWTSICEKMMIGTVVFQLLMIGELTLKGKGVGSILLILPLALTIVFWYQVSSYYKPSATAPALESAVEQDKADENVRIALPAMILSFTVSLLPKLSLSRFLRPDRLVTHSATVASLTKWLWFLLLALAIAALLSLFCSAASLSSSHLLLSLV